MKTKRVHTNDTQTSALAPIGKYQHNIILL